MNGRELHVVENGKPIRLICLRTAGITVNGTLLISMAMTVGPNTVEMIKAVLASRKYEVQTYRLCVGILNYRKSYSKPQGWASMMLNDEVSSNAITKRVTKHYTVLINPKT